MSEEIKKELEVKEVRTESPVKEETPKKEENVEATTSVNEEKVELVSTSDEENKIDEVETKSNEVKTKKEKKKLSNFILFPLVLGSVCLASAGIIAGVHYATSPLIEVQKDKKNLQACYDLIGEANVKKLVKKEIPTGSKYIQLVYEVEVADEYASKYPTYKNFYYFVSRTRNGFKGPITIGTIIAGEYGKNGVLFNLKATDVTSEDSLGANQLVNIVVQPGYTGEGSMVDSQFISGVTAKVTMGAVEDAVKEAIDAFSGVALVSPGYVKDVDGFEMYYNESTHKTYGNYSGNVYIKDEKVYKVEISSFSNTLESSTSKPDCSWLYNGGSYGYGFGDFDFTSFSSKYYNETDGVAFSVFTSDSPTLVIGATEATNGYIEFIKSTINLYNEHHK